MMNVGTLVLAGLILSTAACANDIAAPGTLPPLVGANGPPPTTVLAATTAAVAATTAAAAVPTAVPTVAPAVTATVAPETTTAVVATAADPHGAAIETGCVRSNIDFAAVRAAPGVDQAQLGEIPPGTCDVVVYAIGSDGRIPWLQVASGEVFGWSAESNFVQTSFAPAP